MEFPFSYPLGKFQSIIFFHKLQSFCETIEFTTLLCVNTYTCIRRYCVGTVMAMLLNMILPEDATVEAIEDLKLDETVEKKAESSEEEVEAQEKGEVEPKKEETEA